jgi:hypothetical protein
VLAVGGNATAKLSGLDIGTPAVVTQVKGTLVCNVSGAVDAGNSVLVDTGAIPLSARGNGVSSARSVRCPCSAGPATLLFLIRIVEPVAFANLESRLEAYSPLTVTTTDGDNHGH